MVKTTAKVGTPFADSPIAQYISKQIDIVGAMGVSQRDIAAALGYDKPNMISMFKTGTAKVPLEKIPALAAVLKVDAAFLFRMAMNQYWPELGLAIAEIFGTICTKNEIKILDFIREISKGTDPDLSRDLQAKLRAALK
jgi:transcriptional regulator with XRE-family HTH domain